MKSCFRLLTEINQSNGNEAVERVQGRGLVSVSLRRLINRTNEQWTELMNKMNRVSVSLRRLINRTIVMASYRAISVLLLVSVSLRRLINRTPSPKNQQSQRLTATFAWENQNLHHPHLQTHQKSRPALHFQGAGQNASRFSIFDTLPRSPAYLISISQSPICTVLPPNQVHFKICGDTPNLTS